MKISTIVKCADNSGPKFVRIIKILKSSAFADAKIGDHLVASVLSVHHNKKFKVNKGSLVRCICIRVSQPIHRKPGNRIRFQYPAVIILKLKEKRWEPRGTAIYGPIPRELREKGHIRLVSLSTIAL
jgi:large subunit ribosomal protein L14